MTATSDASYPYPDDPALAGVSRSLQEAGHWGIVVDADWNLVFVTDELRRSFGGGGQLVDFVIGAHYFGPEAVEGSRHWQFGPTTAALYRKTFASLGPYVIADTPGGREAVREAVAPELRDMVDELEAADDAARYHETMGTGLRGTVNVKMIGVRVRDETGRIVGTMAIFKPEAGMDIISTMISNADLRHLERMQHVAAVARRPAAILFADLEGSSQLARRLPTAAYFSLGRRLVRAADECVVEAGGLVGRHVGDGVVAFFLAESAGSESAAARGAITAVRSMRTLTADVAEASGLEADEISLRFGLHWGSTVHVGSIITGARAEVTALGDEVNEAARIEACASGSRALASKDLVERLSPDDATALGIEPGRLVYTTLTDLPTATEKARRDAPAIAVTEI